MHDADPETEDLPATQLVQGNDEVAPVVAEDVPAGQPMHTDEAVASTWPE